MFRSRSRYRSSFDRTRRPGRIMLLVGVAVAITGLTGGAAALVMNSAARPVAPGTVVQPLVVERVPGRGDDGRVFLNLRLPDGRAPAAAR